MAHQFRPPQHVPQKEDKLVFLMLICNFDELEVVPVKNKCPHQFVIWTARSSMVAFLLPREFLWQQFGLLLKTILKVKMRSNKKRRGCNTGACAQARQLHQFTTDKRYTTTYCYHVQQPPKQPSTMHRVSNVAFGFTHRNNCPCVMLMCPLSLPKVAVLILAWFRHCLTSVRKRSHHSCEENVAA